MRNNEKPVLDRSLAELAATLEQIAGMDASRSIPLPYAPRRRRCVT
jgi:hypothetical protein